jgi:hypothetical protein
LASFTVPATLMANSKAEMRVGSLRCHPGSVTSRSGLLDRGSGSARRAALYPLVYHW